MSTTVLLGLTSFEKNWGPVYFWGASNFSNLLAPWASGSRSLMLRAVVNRRYPRSMHSSVRPRRFWHGAAPCPRFRCAMLPPPSAMLPSSFFVFFLIFFLRITIIIWKRDDKLVKFYDTGWLLYQRIINTFRSLPYPCSTMSYSILFSHFHILFSCSKLYSKMLFVLPLLGWNKINSNSDSCARLPTVSARLPCWISLFRAQVQASCYKLCRVSFYYRSGYSSDCCNQNRLGLTLGFG